jgi:hypothetical protein
MTTKNLKKLVAAVTRGEGENRKSFWTKIGVAFENADGSFNLRFDFLPTSTDTTMQLRDFDPKGDD